MAQIPMTLIAGMLYQHVNNRPFRLTGYPSAYIGVYTSGDYFIQEPNGVRTWLSPTTAELLRGVSIPMTSLDQMLPEGF
mgnify:FL=1